MRGTVGTPGNVYGLHGLRLRSAVPLAGFAADGDGFDVDIATGPSAPVPAEAPPGRVLVAMPHAGGYRYVAAGDGRRCILRVPGFCDFVIDRRSGTTVECRPDPSCDPRFVGVLVAGLVVSFLLNLAGDCTLHASAVEVGDGVVAFAGPSGAGKSTLATLLCGSGARLVTDDVLRLGLGAPVVCVGGSPQLRLRPGGAWALDTFEARPSTDLTVDQRLTVTPPPAVGPSPPLSAIVLPRLSREATAMELRPLRGAGAVAELLGACRIVGWKDHEVARTQFHALGYVAAGVRIVEAVIPWGASSREPIVPALLDLGRQPVRRPS